MTASHPFLRGCSISSEDLFPDEYNDSNEECHDPERNHGTDFGIPHQEIKMLNPVCLNVVPSAVVEEPNDDTSEEK